MRTINKISHNLSQNNKGYIALISVLIISTVVLAIAITLNLTSIDETISGLLKEQSEQSFSLADTCLEESYLRLKRDSGYIGGQLNFKQGYCSINIVSSGNRRTITVDSNINNIIRKIKAEIRILGNNNVVQDSWQEL